MNLWSCLLLWLFIQPQQQHQFGVPSCIQAAESSTGEHLISQPVQGFSSSLFRSSVFLWSWSFVRSIAEVNGIIVLHHFLNLAPTPVYMQSCSSESSFPTFFFIFHWRKYDFVLRKQEQMNFLLIPIISFNSVTFKKLCFL